MRHLSYRKPRLRDLGMVFGLVYSAAIQVQQRVSEISADLDAFHAPSECNAIAFRGCDQPLRDAIQFVEDVTNMTWAEIVEEAKARTGGRWLGLTMYELEIPSQKEG